MSRFDRGNERPDTREISRGGWFVLALVAAVVMGVVSVFDPPETPQRVLVTMEQTACK